MKINIEVGDVLALAADVLIAADKIRANPLIRDNHPDQPSQGR
jgi:hypothetical protein